jgi:hypothetical protein
MSGVERPESSLARRRGSVFLAEFVDATRGVEDLLLAGVERVAIRADFDRKVVSQSRPRLERIPAGAGHANFFVLGMRIGFHGVLSIRADFAGRSQEKGRAV